MGTKMPSLVSAFAGLPSQAKRLVAMRFLIYTGFQSTYFIGIIGTLTYSAGADVVSASLAVALMSAATIFGAFAGGTMLDAMGPRKQFFATVLITMVAGTLMALSDGSTSVLLIGAAAIGFCIGMAQLLTTSYPAYLSADKEELQRINSTITTANNISVIVGPIAGGAIATLFSSLGVFPFMAACAVASAAVGLGFHPLRAPRPDNEGGRDGEGAAGTSTFLQSVKTVFAGGVLALLFWVLFLSNLGYAALDPLESFFYRDVLHVGVEWMGWLSAASGAGAVVGALAVMRLPADRVNVRSLLVALALMGAGCIVYVGTPYVAVAFVGQIALGIAYGAIGPLQSTIVQTSAPLHQLGRVNSVMSFGNMVSGVVPLAIAPWLALHIGVQMTLVSAAVVVTVVPLLLLAVVRRR